MSRLVIEVSDETHARFRERAAADGHTVAWLVRSWVEAYLQSREPLAPKGPARGPVHRDMSKVAQSGGGSRK